jgi:phosphate transport system permease protein
MATVASSVGSRRRPLDRFGDLALYGITAAAALGTVVLLVLIAYKVFEGAREAFSKFGLGFITSRAWNPVTGQFGALDFIYGTAVTSILALLIATPLAIAIGLFLTELAPRSVRAVIGPLVEMLAAIPSVILGLWGILVLGPFLSKTLEPFLHDTLGFIPFFGAEPQQSGAGYLPAAIILTIMVVPIVASVSRELFLSVPRDIKEGALALGMTRWEMVRGVVLPSTRSGLAAAVVLGLGRAVGEAIAVTQVIGAQTGIHISLFAAGDTLASRIASQYQGATSTLQVSSLIYLAAILLVMSFIVNLVAQVIVRRFEFVRTGGG